ncbi:MAG: NACHT domain-containing protein [Mucilaginibacter sp.]
MNHLFLIGIDEYPYFKPPANILTTCVKDVTDLKYVLLEKFFFEEGNVIELLNWHATNTNIQTVLEKYSADLDESSNLVIYFSGHGGLRKPSKKGYWIPYDATDSDYSKWLANETILELVKAIPAKHIFIIADCCFATSLLITNPQKSIQEITLDNFKSRWILTSGREETYCGSVGENSFFGESIIFFLGNSETDIRVGTLIEFTKERFKSNILQQPQGHPMLDRNHDCGEFILKIKDSKKLFDRDIKGYNLFKKVIDIYSKSKNVEEIENYEDKSNKIGFTLLREHDKVKKEVTYYLYLYNEINQSRTYSYFFEKYKTITKRNIILFIPLEADQVFHERRLNNIEKLFSPRNIFYIDEFINELSSSSLHKDEDSKYLHISNFILPEFLVANERPRIEMEKWLTKIDSPILVVKGTAGIGKTTYARYISDLYQSLYKNKNYGYVLFIDSGEIQEELLYLQKLGRKIDLYSFYKAATANENSLDKELFSINLDAGNLLLIIDGLDEIISKNISFDIDYFFKSINSSNIGLGNSKIVITTRTFFWDTSNIVDDIIYNIELMPFDLKRAKTFFEKSFKNDELKIKKALSIAEDFKLPSSEESTYYYHPFVLDIIKEIVNSQNQILFNDKAFVSDILNKEIKIDYIIGRICEREVKRIKQIDVDKQIAFFIYLAVVEQGIFDDQEVKEYLKQALLINDVSANIVESFKSHPFLQYNFVSRTLIFKYDFFENYFISLFISKVIDINQSTELQYNTLKLLSQKLYHGSDTIKNITKRVVEWNEDNLVKINDIIQRIKVYHIDDINIVKRAISGLFNLSLAINFKFKSNNRLHNTQLVKDLFSSSTNVIENLVLLNLTSLEDNIRFDFSELTLNNSIFENYSQFWDCNLTKNTHFHKCVLRNIGSPKKDVSIPRTNFVDCDEGDSLNNAFIIRKVDIEAQIAKATIFLDDFLKMFYSNGKYKKISDFLLNDPHNYPKINKYGIKLNLMINLLKENDFIVFIDDKKHNDLKIGINPLYVEIVTKFRFEGKQTESLIKIIDAIVNLGKFF